MNSREDRWRQRLVFAAIVPEHCGFGGPEEEYWHEGKEEPEQDAVVERRHRWLRVRQRGAAPAVQVKRITSEGIELADGLILPSACIFLNGKTFLWDVPREGWSEEHFEVFDVVVPKPGACTCR